MVNTSSIATPLQVPNTVPCLDANPCQHELAAVKFLLSQALAEVARQRARADRLQAELATHHHITANKSMTMGQKQCAHIVTEYLEHRAPCRPSEPQHLSRYSIADEAARYGVSGDALGKGLKQLADMGYIGRTEESVRIAGMKRTVVSVGRGELYDKPEELAPEVVKNGHGGKRVKCPECGSENLNLHATCRDCGAQFAVRQQHAHEPEDADEMNDEYRALLASAGKPEPAPVPEPETLAEVVAERAPTPEPPSESWSNEPAELQAFFAEEWTPGAAADSDPGSIYDQMRVGTLRGRCDKSPVGMHEAGMAQKRPGGPKLCVWCGVEMAEPAEVLA